MLTFASFASIRYKYENNRVMHDSSPDVNSPLPFQLYGNGGVDMASKGTQNQLLERQKAHVQQFVATEDELNKAAEARSTCQKLLRRLYGSDIDSSHALGVGGASQPMSSLRQLELEVWTKEREAAGLKASLTTLMSEVQRLNMLCEERKEAEDSLKSLMLEERKDPSAIPSICRVSAALQYPGGLEGSDAGLASVLESMEFCLKLRGSEACVLEELAKAINLVHIRRDLVESGHSLLNHAYHSQQEYERTTSYCLDLASEQEKTITEKWLPDLRNGAVNAQKSLDDCKYVTGLLEEWWEQPASTVVDWVTVDGQNVAAWNNHVKQLLAFYDKELL